MKSQLICMKCRYHGFYVVKNETLEAHYYGDPGSIPTTQYEYECMNCGETKELEWEEL